MSGSKITSHKRRYGWVTTCIPQDHKGKDKVVCHNVTWFITIIIIFPRYAQKEPFRYPFWISPGHFLFPSWCKDAPVTIVCTSTRCLLFFYFMGVLNEGRKIHMYDTRLADVTRAFYKGLFG